MAGWSGGVFTRARNWVTDKNGAANPQAALFDQEDDNFALGLNNCVTKDGQSVPSGSLLWPAASINSLNSLTSTQITTGALTASGVTALNGATTVAGSLATGAAFAIGAAITPTAFGATQNDWAPTSIATSTRVKMSATIASHLTGISAGQVDGRVLFLYNNGGFTITLDHDSASSTAANRFYNSSGSNLSVPNFASVMLIYDATLARWLSQRA